MIWKILKFLLKLSVSAGLMVFLIRKIDLYALKALLPDMIVWYLMIPLVLWFISMYFGTARWMLYLPHVEHRLKVGFLFTLTWIGHFLSNFLPSNIGGDAYKFVVLKKYKNMPGKIVFASLILDRGIGLYAMLVTAFFLSLPFAVAQYGRIEFLKSVPFFVFVVIYGAGFLSLGMVLFFLLSRHGYQIPVTFRSNWVRKLMETLNIVLSYKNAGNILLGMLFTLGFLVLSSLSIFFQFKAYRTDVAFLHIMMMLPLISIIEMVPISINAIGIKEGAAVFLFGLYGYPAEVVLSVFLINRFLALLLSATGGIRYVFFKHGH
jgi:hypothetical protein